MAGRGGNVGDELDVVGTLGDPLDDEGFGFVGPAEEPGCGELGHEHAVNGSSDCDGDAGAADVGHTSAMAVLVNQGGGPGRHVEGGGDAGGAEGLEDSGAGAEVDVGVDEAGQEGAACSIEGPRSGWIGTNVGAVDDHRRGLGEPVAVEHPDVS